MRVTTSRLAVAVEAVFAYPPYEDEEQDVMSSFVRRAQLRIANELDTLPLHLRRNQQRVHVVGDVRPAVKRLGRVLWRGTLELEGAGDWVDDDAKNETAAWLNNVLLKLAAEPPVSHPPVATVAVSSMQISLQYE